MATKKSTQRPEPKDYQRVKTLMEQGKGSGYWAGVLANRQARRILSRNKAIRRARAAMALATPHVCNGYPEIAGEFFARAAALPTG